MFSTVATGTFGGSLLHDVDVIAFAKCDIDDSSDLPAADHMAEIECPSGYRCREHLDLFRSFVT